MDQPRRKKTVTLSFDGQGAFQLLLELDPFVKDEDLRSILGVILQGTIQRREVCLNGIHWDHERLRQSDAFIGRIAGLFRAAGREGAAASAPTRTRRPARRIAATSLHRPTPQE
jgi:hypothetical protein